MRAEKQSDHWGGVFIGDTLSFSDTTLKLARSEFGCLNFRRLTDLSRIMDLSEDRRAMLRTIIVDESEADVLRESFADFQAACSNAHFTLAYRNRKIARDLLMACQGYPALHRIGFLPMNFNIDLWLSVLRLLVGGDRYVPSELTVPDPDEAKTTDLVPPARDNPPLVERPKPAEQFKKKLTARELQVLRYAAAGKQNKIIADELDVSQHTVKLHMHHVIAKLGVSNRTEAAIWYLNNRPCEP